MSKKVTKELKQTIVQRYLNGETVAAITRETQISRSTLYLWIRGSQVSPTKKIQLRDLSRLKCNMKDHSELPKFYKQRLVLRHRLFGKNLMRLF